MWVTSALAVSLSLQAEDSPREGVTVRHYRASSPDTDVTVVRVDLCAEGIHLDATRTPSSLKPTHTWAAEEGALVASNGDFFKSGPVRVYGDAVGGAVRWPEEQRGSDLYEGEWYYRDYGWIAFGHDQVWFTHSKWVKNNLEPTTGFKPNTKAPEPPDGVIALVSGFPELVIDGVPIDCSSPTADDCFPDRSDMRARHPRTAMGLTEDMETLILAVADGRTSGNSGMYGEELAETMGKLGAWVAFNLDGGGSAQLWADGSYVNTPSESYRSTANHWGVFADESWLPSRAGSCASAEPCSLLGPEGGTLSESGGCFRSFGPRDYWRSEEEGEGGHRYWTNVFVSDTPSNHAWWQFELEESGRYRIEAYVESGTYAAARYALHDGTSFEVDQSAGGWVVVGEAELSSGARQWLQLSDHVGADPGSNKRIVADSVRLVRLDLPDPEDTAPPGDTSPPADSSSDSGPWLPEHTDTPGERVPLDVGCSTTPVAGLWLALLLMRTRAAGGPASSARRSGRSPPVTP